MNEWIKIVCYYETVCLFSMDVLNLLANINCTFKFRVSKWKEMKFIDSQISNGIILMPYTTLDYSEILCLTKCL